MILVRSSGIFMRKENVCEFYTEDKKLSEMSLTELAMIKTLEEEWTEKSDI